MESSVEVTRIEAENWKRSFSESAHNAGFKRYKDPEKERIDYALIGSRGEDLVSYLTCKELDADTVYWQFGASVGPYRHRYTVWRTFLGALQYAQKKYKRVVMFVENDNFAMLKMAWRAGFRASGIRYFKDQILLEHTLTFKENDYAS